MRNLELLDCTLRDGGYVNNWNFGNSTVLCVIQRLIEANIKFIEVGFLDERQPADPERSIQPDTKAYDKLLANIDSKDAMLLAMIDYGTCGIENISPCCESKLDGIRVIFKKPKMREAVAFGNELKKLGYAVFLQMVSITSYSDKDILEFVELVNEVRPYAVSMVDTYGLMHKEKMLHYYHLLDHNLAAQISIGYHSHNNFQLAYANTCELITHKSKRPMLVDGTVYGMGKSAGNAPLELLAMYLNNNYDSDYDLNQILEVIDTNIMKIYKEKYWGYDLLYFLAASNDCHPSYIQYLLSKKTLSVNAVNDIVKDIPDELKLNYSQSYIEDLYIKYQKQIIRSEDSLRDLRMIIDGKKVLLLGPGATTVSHMEKITEYINAEKPLVISVNNVPGNYPLDYVFVSNSKRYNMLVPTFTNEQNALPIIATSNVTSAGKPFNYLLNYAELIDEDHLIEDNALIMILKVLCNSSPDSVALAGFDGFNTETADQNYYDSYMDFRPDNDKLSVINEAVRKKLPEFKEKLELFFLTPSLYDRGESV